MPAAATLSRYGWPMSRRRRSSLRSRLGKAAKGEHRKQMDPAMRRHPAHTTVDEVGGIIAAFETRVGDRERPLAIIARFCVRAGTGPRIEKAFADASAETAKEDGALAYQLHREPENSDPRNLEARERWSFSRAPLESEFRAS
jgi:hypothetical protein